MKKDELEYRRELLAVVEQMRGSAESVQIRGAGLTQYVYAQQGASFVELSWDFEGIWVQFWDTHSEFERQDRTFASYTLAIQAAIRWLQPGTLADST